MHSVGVKLPLEPGSVFALFIRAFQRVNWALLAVVAGKVRGYVEIHGTTSGFKTTASIPSQTPVPLPLPGPDRAHGRRRQISATERCRPAAGAERCDWSVMKLGFGAHVVSREILGVKRACSIYRGVWRRRHIQFSLLVWGLEIRNRQDHSRRFY